MFYPHHRLTTRGLLIVVLGFLLFSPLPSPAAALVTTRYVAPGGGCGGHTPCYTSVQAAVDAAVAGDTILVAEGDYTGVSTRNGDTQMVYLDQGLTIRGGYTPAYAEPPDPAAHPTTLDAENLGRVFYIPDIGAAHPLTLEGLHLTNGLIAYNATDPTGGGIRVFGGSDDLVTVRNCWISHNTAGGLDPFGGGIAAQNVQVRLIDNVITQNTGAGIELIESNSPVLTGNTISENSKWGVYIRDQRTGSGMSIQGNLFANNTSDGLLLTGINSDSGQEFIHGNTFDGNYRGLSASFVESNLLIDENTFQNNFNPTSGGIGARGAGARLAFSNAEMVGNLFTANASYFGGGLSVMSASFSTVTIRDNRFSSNTSGDGGAIQLEGEGTVTVQGNILTGNQGQYGGGLAIDKKTTAIVRGNRLIDNTATAGGGGVYCRACTLTLERNWLTGNMASTHGNALHFQWLPFDMYAIPQTVSIVKNNILYDDETDSTPTVTIHSTQVAMIHNTILRNPASIIGVGIWVEETLADLPASVVLTNTIVGGHHEGIRLVSGSASTHSTLWGKGDWANDSDWYGPVTTASNLWGDPLFVDPASLDFHITASSPARDAGVAVLVTNDIDNEPRPHADTGLYDIGADEYHLDDLRTFLPLLLR